jgi:hypothetical protein
MLRAGRDIVGIVDFLVCPDDGERLKAAPDREPGELPLRVGCPKCGKQFTFGPGGLQELPAEPGG